MIDRVIPLSFNSSQHHVLSLNHTTHSKSHNHPHPLYHPRPMHAPKPLLAAFQNTDRHTLSPLTSQLPTALERLRSPIHLTEPSSDLLPSPPTISPQRRSKPSPQSARRRRSTRESRVTPHPHAFDDLPWIASLESSPDVTNPWDIADLSLLPVSSELPASGPGPVRRRKTSLRSSPLASSSKAISLLPIRDTSLLPSPSLPTPRSRFTSSRVLFQNLMPVACDSSMYQRFTN